MIYVINPDTKVNYSKLKNDFEKLKKLEMTNTKPEIKILLSNNYYSISLGNFTSELNKYTGKIVELILIKENLIEKIIGPIIFNNSKQIFLTLSFIVEFFPRDSVDFESEFVKTYVNFLKLNNQINFITYE